MASGSGLTIGELLRLWAERPGIALATRRRERWQAEALITPVLGDDRPVRSLSPRELEVWRDDLVASTAPSTSAVTVRHLRAALRWGCETGRLPGGNPARALAVPSVPRTQISEVDTKELTG